MTVHVPVPLRGRPPGTSRRALELVALQLFAEQGIDATTIEQIAHTAGVSKRTFFRYFSSKDGVLWDAFDDQVAAIRETLAAMPAELKPMDAVRQGVVEAIRTEPVRDLRTRMSLIGTPSAPGAGAAAHYQAWEDAISEFVADRTGERVSDLFPQAVGHATLAVARAAYDAWVSTADGDLADHVDRALAALASGFRHPVTDGASHLSGDAWPKDSRHGDGRPRDGADRSC